MKSFLISIMIIFSLFLQAEEIPLQNDQRAAYSIEATLYDDIPVVFVIDSKAKNVVIPKRLFNELRVKGLIQPSDMRGKGLYWLRDDEVTKNTRNFNIRRLKIGQTVIKNVLASTKEDDSTFLLGQSALKELKPWSIDTQKNVFKFGPEKKVKTYQKNYISPSRNISRYEAMDFVRYFIALHNDKQLNNDRKLKKILPLYASKVDYLNLGIITREDVSTLKKNYFKEWSKINITMLKLLSTKDVFHQPNQKVVEYKIVYKLYSEDSDLSRSGQSIITLILQKTDGTIKIIKEKHIEE